MSEDNVTSLIKSNLDLIKRFDTALDRLKDVEEDFKRQASLIEYHNKILFGDGENVRGLIGRQSKMEDRFAIFWTSMGVLVSAMIVATVNFFARSK